MQPDYQKSLEDELKRAEKKNEELIAFQGGPGARPPGDSAGGAAQAVLGVDLADPDVYGRTMTNVIDNVVYTHWI